jgi:15-cis-phytoene synthase
MTGHRLDDPIVRLSAERIAVGSKSFAGAARLFDPSTRASAFMLYAWCRHCDDEIDGQVLGFGRHASRRPPTEVLKELREKTLGATRGEAEDPVFVALQRVVRGHDIAAVYPLDLIRGMEMDVEFEAGARRYETRDDLIAYCYHVAGVVGVMMAMVMGARERAVLIRASDLGIAFQLTNIVRDLVADADVKRVYVPDDMLKAHGLDWEDIGTSDKRGQLFTVASDLLDMADAYYRSAELGIPHLPFRSAWAVASARRVYGDIGAIVRHRGIAAWDTRSSTGRARKLAGVARAAVDVARSRRVVASLALDDRAGLWTPPSLRNAPAVPGRQT